MIKGQLVWDNSPPCSSSPLECGLGLALAQLLIEISVLECREAVGIPCVVATLNLLHVVIPGEWMTSGFLSVLHGYFEFVEYVYTIKIKFPLK